ncbi:DUF6293 family protein [Natrialba sp. SSL1]|uniref:HFX_2341 family transcriptional regulator domain-containing protein n=1 Tax=Natrialba sp. SSL1 TaxID=1869245 RepID=UPI0008F8EB2F|nr:DUF6293 family protein [Natrialba sp. SSL1]OIB56178.1 hypothetical protein BBD46_19430 [Natrialba sp. SSL1]
MNVADRVQIVPLGYERERVKEPIYRFNADKVVLLRQDNSTDHETEYQRNLVSELADNDRIELETTECDFFDLESALRALTRTIRDHDNHDVYVNASTGSKITAIAAVVACQNLDATPFYVRPEFRNDDGKLEPPAEPLVSDVGEITDIPVFSLEKPSTNQLQILSYLAEEDGATKKELIAFSKSREFDFIVNSETTSQEGLYRLLETHIIDPLQSESFITVEKDGRTKRVYLADRGNEALQIFQPE